MRKIKFNDLPRYSALPKKLMDLGPDDIHRKSKDEVLREFNDEKWQKLQRLVSGDLECNLNDLEEAYCPGDTEIACFYQGTFFETKYKDASKLVLKHCANVLKKYAGNAAGLVELGAGFGSKILSLAQLEQFSKMSLVAGEISANGRDVMTTLSKRMGVPLLVGSCDFYDLSIDRGLVPEGSLIFTSYSAHYIPHLNAEFVNYLISLKPSTVVHFEPIYEHFNEPNIHDLMCQRYFILNDYTKNMLSVIRSAESDGKVKIVSESMKEIGVNPFLPASTIVWSPR
jgi:hypothetical protein